jgi:hypothetical protein
MDLLWDSECLALIGLELIFGVKFSIVLFNSSSSIFDEPIASALHGSTEGLAHHSKGVDLTGLFCTSRIERLEYRKDRKYAKEDIHAGADRSQAAAD